MLAISASTLFKAAEAFPEFDVILSKTSHLLLYNSPFETFLDIEECHQDSVNMRNVFIFNRGCHFQGCVRKIPRISENGAKTTKVLSW